MTSPAISPLGRHVGAYVIESEIARGGMAIVYRALQPSLDRHVALKELASFPTGQAALAERFVRESRVAASLRSENIVHVNDFFQHGGVPYIAMELLRRGSLRPYIQRLSLPQVAGVLEGVLAGLAHAHAHGIIHRDLKPENVLVTDDGAVKIADFGIAKAYSHVWSHLTATGTTMGTPVYMAPEQAQALELTPQTDLYAVGVLAYELLLGRPPFPEQGEPVAVMLRHIQEPVPSPHDLDPAIDDGLAAWLAHMLAKDPACRPASARAAWDAFDDAAVRLAGSFWRRNARLADPGTAVEATSPDAPLREATFPSNPPPAVDVEPDYVTVNGRKAEPPAAEVERPDTEPPLPTPQPPAVNTPQPLAPPAEPAVTAPPAPEPTVAPRAPVPVPPKPPATGEAPRDTPGRRRGRLLAALALFVVASAAAAASLQPTRARPPAPMLSAPAVEAEIRSRLEPVNTVETVRCPQVELRRGGVFECVAVLAGGQQVQVRVEQVDDRGRVRVQPHV